MKQTIFILVMLFGGCSTQQEQNNKRVIDDTLNTRIEQNTKFILTETNNCEQTKLSYQFDILIDFKRYTDTKEKLDSCLLKIFIKDKVKKSTVDSFSIVSTFYVSGMFMSCDSMTSFTTNFNSDRKIVDNYFGDLVVVDINFDGKDDIAVINDSGGTGGPFYSYYTQTKDKKFIKDQYLTDSVTYFPDKIDKTKKRLTTLVVANAYSVGEHTYHLDRNSYKWRAIRHKIIGEQKE
ncbi:FG-GAP repeat protein [Flectobacillus roseus]|uniref:FG-GAP repeat protein n=1 Tax=Flectobacillus roseus TaxID=502259 RepID=UPI0024B7B9C0|nr:hypothetical protein [Flectobacillus roseus]MDI9871924.1 hypothetical protein [Flectobacillus roseus]